MSRLIQSEDEQTLCDMMSGWSEREHAAGWLIGLEYILWQELQSPSPRLGVMHTSAHIHCPACKYGQPQHTDTLLEGVRSQSQLVGGWIIWPNTPEPLFVPMDEWLKIAEIAEARMNEEFLRPSGHEGSQQSATGSLENQQDENQQDYRRERDALWDEREAHRSAIREVSDLHDRLVKNYLARFTLTAPDRRDSEVDRLRAQLKLAEHLMGQMAAFNWDCHCPGVHPNKQHTNSCTVPDLKKWYVTMDNAAKTRGL